MTPLICEMMRWSPAPEQATWFDLGRMESTEGRRINAETVLHLPYARTAIVCTDKNGEKVVLWLLSGDGANSVTVAGCTASGKGFEPFAYMATDEGMKYYKGKSQVSESDVHVLFRMVCACLIRLQDCTEAHKPTIKANSLTNRRLIAKGKPPLIYDWHTVKLEPSKAKAEHQGGTHATPRRHQCRGHWRNLNSGKQVWVSDCWKGDASKGTVFKDYEAKV